MKLSQKVHLYSSVLFIVLFSIASVIIYVVFSKMSLKHEFEQVHAEAKKASVDIQQVYDSTVITELLRAYVPIHGLISIVDDSSEKPITVTSSSEIHLSQLKLSYSPSVIEEQLKINNQSYSFVSLPFINQDGRVMNLQMIVNLSELMTLLRLLRIILVIVAICVIIPAILSSRLLSNLIMKPIKAMMVTMKSIVSSHRFVRLEQTGQSKDELYEMGETFNEMIALLESNYKRQEQFVSNASHEFKTPLTVIESYASLIKRRGKQQPDLLDESIEAIHSEAIRMKAMTEQLLILAKPIRQWNIEFTETDLLPIVTKTAQYINKAYGRQIIVYVQKDKEARQAIELENRLEEQHYAVMVKTDAELLTQLLIIFLDNARKYSEDVIEIEIEQRSSLCLISVVDHGVGIAKSSLPYVFERFYREDEARTRDVHDDRVSAGLGLSLAKEIAVALHIKVELDSVEGVGTTARIVFNDISQ